MTYGIGIIITERIVAAAVSDDAISGSLRAYPEDSSNTDSLQGVPVETIVKTTLQQVQQIELTGTPTHVGVGIPGIVRNGIIEDSPNLIQFKGVDMQGLVTEAFTPAFGKLSVSIFNDADVMAAGIAATRGHLDRLIRVWTLGNGIGFGRYPARGRRLGSRAFCRDT